MFVSFHMFVFPYDFFLLVEIVTKILELVTEMKCVWVVLVPSAQVLPIKV